MNANIDEIKKFLYANFHDGLDGYFDSREYAEQLIVETGVPTPRPSPSDNPSGKALFIDVDQDAKGYGDRYVIRLLIPRT